MTLETEYIKIGKELGYSSDELRKYVKNAVGEERKRIEGERIQKEEERKANEIIDREKRVHEREMKTFEDEERKRVLEMKKLDQELELARMRTENPGTEPLHGSRHNKSFIKLANYTPGQDVSVYLQVFEKVKSANEWSDSVAYSALLNGFSGSKVSLFLNTLPMDLTYDEIKHHIIKSFGYTIYDYQEKFRNCKQGSESIRQHVLFLKDYFAKMCNLANVNSDFQNLENLIIKDQLLNSTSKNLCEFLKERNIFALDLEEVIAMADNYQAIHGTGGFGRKNDFSKGTGAVNNNYGDRSFDLKCYNCGKFGHSAKYCRSLASNFIPNQAAPNKTSSDLLCYFCNEGGHFSRNCPKKFANVSNTNVVDTKNPVKSTVKEQYNFFAVGSEYKYDKSLPVSFGKCNDTSVKILRDTGATTVLVKRSLVGDSDITDEMVTLHFADGHSVIAPTANIKLDCPYFVGVTKAACLDKLPFDVLVGNINGAVCACAVDQIKFNNETAFAVQTRNQILTEDKPDVQTAIGNREIEFDVDSVNTQELIALQKDDPKLNVMFEKCNKPSLDYPKFQLINGVLTKFSLQGKNCRNEIKQIILPGKLKTKIMKLAHDNIFAGHLGIRKTQDRILSHFFWPGCFSDIKRYCRSCEVCQKFGINKPAKAPMVTVPVIGKPFSRVALDIIGPLPKSRKGNRFALVSIDLATKYPDAVALKRIDSDTIAEAMLEIYARVGLPEEILHDQGTQLISAVMKKFNKLLQIKSIRTSPYHPRTNGTCENFNKTLKQMLRKISADDPLTWDRYLQPLLFAYREVPQTSTGFSPFELLFSHNARGPLFLIKERLLNLDCETEEVPVTTYVMNMRDKLKQFMELSNENERSSKIKEKTYYDRNCRQRKFAVGDKVLLLLPTSASKLIAEWKGPFEIVRKIGRVDYVIRVGDREKVFHINMLKLFKERLPVDNAELVNCAIDLNDELPSSFPIIGESDNLNFNLGINLNSVQKEQMLENIGKYSSSFSDRPGKVNFMKYKIKVSDKLTPKSCVPYKLPFNLRDKVKDELNKWLEYGIIRKSSSEYASPIVVVKNKDGSIRITTDYRKINEFVNIDHFPMPRIDNVLERLQGAKFMTKIDLTKAFLQIPLTEDSCKYTSFITDYGQFEFLMVPFGIKFATGICNRIIKHILEDCESFVDSFVDDLVIFSTTFEDHVKHVSIVLNKLLSNGITLNKKKCVFGSDSIKFLGFVVGHGKLSPDSDKIEAIKSFPKPIVKKDMRSFLGLLNFYRRFAPNVASYIAPLNDTLRKFAPDKICWTSKLNDSFEEAIKLMTVNCSPLYLPRKDYKFVLQTDACDTGVGSVLWQRVEGVEYPIVFISRKLNSAELKYAVIEKECLCIKWAIEKLHDYLYGCPFIVRTDHAPLQWLMENKNTTSRRMRWALALQPYEFSVEYIKGSDNFIADVLSRYPVEN